MVKKISLRPNNYKQIDTWLSRSAQPVMENLEWLREQGVTDIINLRNMSKDNFDEGKFVKELGMTYHSIPSVTKFIKNENAKEILDVIELVKRKGGKVHLHCDHGSDRTGIISYIYERLHNIGTPKDNVEELNKYKWQKNKYPDLINWAEDIISKFLENGNY